MKKTILVIEDEKFNINVLVDILKPKYNLKIFKSGEQALEKVKSIDPDLILLDILLPGLNGYEVCKKLKSDIDTKDIPIFFMTVKNNIEDIVYGYELGAVDFITKPINYIELLSRIKHRLTLIDHIKELSKRKKHFEEISALLPICPRCKKVKNEDGYWSVLEKFINDNSEIELSHGLCPKCIKIHYPDYYNKQPEKFEESLKSNRVLIIEDEAVNITLLRDSLESDYKLDFAETGAEAFERMESFSYDLILLDVMLPDQTGFELCEIIKKSQKWREIPIIFMTVRSDPNDIIMGFQLGAADYLPRPINYRELKEKVKTHIAFKNTINSLKITNKNISEISRFIPICSHCKSIRDDNGFWQEINDYFSKESLTTFTRSLCPECKPDTDN